MSQNPIITLLSDFGINDVYVGVMKGVIAQINPALTIIDLTHEIPRQNIAAARFNLMNAYPYFPDRTIHVAVVDPGVGSQRRAIALQADDGFLVGPDNGLFSGILTQSTIVFAVELTNPEFWRTPTPSQTFHGRDIFAPVGAHLASGVPLAELGSVIEPSTLVQLPIPELTKTATGITGSIQYIDHFGNLITDIPAADVTGKTWLVTVNQRQIPTGQTYSDRPLGELIALIGSHGWVEIAVNGGSAQSELQLELGKRVDVAVTTENEG
ncbi:MAG: SAM-dependent chlorinase/fluorinase [Coleofasciculus chthonoplastes F3-SA18-01]|uniref:SAM hydrolase/SAM-dependent halogenase family protein n=1 Tax=Coleofasciculus chthonoplastes TaxID=64178 RepID=UPI0032F7947D